MDRPVDARAGSILLIVLLVLSVGAFALTRSLRSSDDVVNTVVFAAATTPGGKAEVSFVTTESDQHGAVYVIDADERTVAMLQAPGDLAAGRHEFSWDGRTDSGAKAPPGTYSLRVVLGDAGRDIIPPGSVTIAADGSETAVSGYPGESP